ncbi:MAG TPA: YcaO-like family protein [Selenomonadales bacterium]|nr:YcaO-like family protein [Selenomonadales bacterium]
MSFSGMKYKDARPLATINRIKDILGELGLLPVETMWRNSVDGFYSVNVQISGTDLSTNGKGTTEEFALASAYGEMMERIQNQCTFRLSFDFRQEALEYRGFFYAPDEVPLSSADLLSSREDWINDQWSRMESGIDKAQLLTLWQAVSYEEVPADFIALPYCNLTRKTISHIPVKMASKMYMSNGMCAGNTPEEALVQGISEVLERNANQRIIREKLVPPTVSREYIARFPRLDAMITEIEASGNKEVIVKDCSLGAGFPVVAIIYVERDTQRYFVKFGSHPFFESALERTLTELLQGQDIRRMMGVREFSYHCAGDQPENLMGILVNGSGVYPTEFFGPAPSYPFREFPSITANSNKELLSYIIGFLRDKGYDVYARDVSFLGFPAFHVVVPGLSEIEKIDDTGAITDYAEYNRLRRLLRQIDRLTPAEAEELAAFFAKRPYNPDTTIADLLNLPFSKPALPWYYTNIDLFLTALACRRKDLAGAHAIFSRFVENTGQSSPPASVLTYYRCVRDYLGTCSDGLPEEAAVDLLNIFYPLDVVGGVIAEFAEPEQVLTSQGNLSCWNCADCRFRYRCQYTAMERVFMLLKDRYAVSGIEQKRLTELV